MRRLAAGVALFLALLGAPAATQPQDEAIIAIVHVNVIPMTGDGPVLTDYTVVVERNRIAQLGPSNTTRTTQQTRQIDGSGKYLMPGLADMHVHLEYFDDPRILAAFTANGVTTVRNMDGRRFILDWKARIAAGTLPGPRIYTSGPLLDGSPPVRPDNTVVAGPDDARAAVETQLNEGYDFIKVYSALSIDAYNAILETARARRAVVSGHVPRAIGIDRALAAGQHSIEHLLDFGSEIQSGQTPAWSRRYLAMPIDADKVTNLAGRLAKSGVWVVPTLVQPERDVQRDDEVTRRLASDEVRVIFREGRQLWERQVRAAAARMDEDDWTLIAAGRVNRLRVVKALHAAGVRLLAGTDTPNPFVVPGYSIHDEMALLVEAGLTPTAALASATRDAGRYVEADWGVIQKGALADLLLLEGNPLDDIANTRRIAGVLVNGRWIGKEARQSLLQSIQLP
jgi:imidazolonepropionase-like amidohydrolase